MASSPPVQGTGYVNLSRYLDANQDALGREAQGLADSDTAAAEKALGNDRAEIAKGPSGVADYAQNQTASQNAYNNLQGLTNGTGNLQNQLATKYGPGENARFDADLLGNSGQAQQTFRAAQAGKGYADGGQFQGLNGYLNSAMGQPGGNVVGAPRAPSAQQAAPQPFAAKPVPSFLPQDKDEQERQRGKGGQAF